MAASPHGDDARSQASIGLLFALSAALLWSSSGVGIKLLPMSGPAIAGFRSLFALPILAIVLLRSPAARKLRFYRDALADPWVWAASAAYAVCVTLFVLSTKLTTAANAILFQYSAPIYTALLSWPLLGERVRGADWLAVLGCLLGIGLCFVEKLSGGGLLGNLLALLSGLGFALVPLIWRRQLQAAAREPRPDGTSDHRKRLVELTLLLGNLITAFVALPSLLSEPPRTGAIWLGVALLGTVQIGVAYLLYGAAIRRLRAVECLLAATLEPILNPVWVALWAHESPGPQTLLGGAVIVVTVVLHGLYIHRPPRL
jgi:drug/metabolite transporter (DMT)-like permease